MGIVLESLGELEEAVGAHRTALKVAPGYADVHCHLAELLKRLGQCDRAREHWSAYLRRETDKEWLRYAQARLQSSE